MGERWIARGEEIGAEIVRVRGHFGVSGGQLELRVDDVWGVRKEVRFARHKHRFCRQAPTHEHAHTDRQVLTETPGRQSLNHTN